MQKTFLIIGSIIIIFLIIGVWTFFGRSGPPTQTRAITSFDECAQAGHPVMESYPRQCKTPTGENFVEKIANPVSQIDLSDLIIVETPKSGDTVETELKVTGKARGNWFFEASFPVSLVDSEGNVLAEVPAQAQGDWMTTDFVPFEATLVFTAPAKQSNGTLILKKDNPSGLPEHDARFEIPVIISR